MKKLTVAAVAIGGMLTGTIITIWGFPTHWKDINSVAVTSAPSPLPALATSSVVGVRPASLQIPSLKLTANIVGLGINDQGEFAAPSNASEVGWYLVSGYPGVGDPRQAILLDGHLTDQQGQPAVFAKLATLSVGDQLSLTRHDGRIYQYQVVETATLPLAQIDMNQLVLSPDLTLEGLTIITCAGNFQSNLNTYDERLVVRAVLNES